MHTEAHRDFIRQARHFIYISGTGEKMEVSTETF